MGQGVGALKRGGGGCRNPLTNYEEKHEGKDEEGVTIKV